MISKYGENGENLISNIKEESKENIEFNLENNIMNDTETIGMLVTFANTIFSEHPNTSFLIEKCDNSSSDFINVSNNSIKGEFEIPSELKNHIEVLKYDIDTSEAFSNGNNYLTMDIDCTVTLSIKTTKEEAIAAIEKYQEDNDDLRWSLSIKWIDADNKEQYSFDSWDEDMLEEIIEDEPCWYERSNINDTDIGKNVEEADLEIYLMYEGTLFTYIKDNQKEMTFEAFRLVVECPGADDYEWEVKDALGELVFTTKGDSKETYLITDLPEDIVDYEFTNSVGNLHDDALNSLEEAVDFIKNLKTISFKEINPKDGESICYID